MSASELPTRAQTAAGAPRGAEDAGAAGATARTAVAPPGASPERPILLDRYHLQRRLGAGAFGVVWLARDERLERDVAIKIVPRERVVGGRLEREARAAARLSHPAIVTLYEALADDENAYLVSELVRGWTLDRLLDAGRLSDRDMVGISIALCDALEHAHGQGVIHRDVKPSNILVPDQPASAAQVAKLTDFGVARVVGGDSLTRPGDVLGTAEYMSPEQAEGLDTGPAADLYSLALVTYEALTGVNPIKAGTSVQRARRLGAYLPPLRRQRRDLPLELGRGIDLALRPKPRERGTTAELRRALLAGLDDVGDIPGVVESPWPTRARRHRETEMPARPGSIAPRRSRRAPQPQAPAPRSVTPAEPAPRLDHEPQPPVPREAWPARAAAAVTTAFLAAWLTSHLLASSAIPPAAAGFVAGVVTFLLPRIGYATTTGAFVLAAAAQSRPGAALVILIAALLPAALLPRSPTVWPLAAFAPALGLLSLAGAWPALAGRAANVWRRAALGCCGWAWLALATPLSGTGLYLRKNPATPPTQSWIASLHETTHLILTPLINSGALAAAPVWAAAAVALPWAARGRTPALDVIRAAIWGTGTVLATVAVIDAANGGAHLIGTQMAVLGGVVSALVALAPTAPNALRRRRLATRGRDLRSMETP
jgi:serine/threonine protein kinase